MTEAVRLRSNVVVIRDDADRLRARASLPGEVAADTLPLERMTRQQQNERHLYEPCIACHRSLWRIARQGCEHNCAALTRALALQDVSRTFQEARRLLASEAHAPADMDPGRGRVEPIPEWNPE
jgi:hypothetical protein